MLRKDKDTLAKLQAEIQQLKNEFKRFRAKRTGKIFNEELIQQLRNQDFESIENSILSLVPMAAGMIWAVIGGGISGYRVIARLLVCTKFVSS